MEENFAEEALLKNIIAHTEKKLDIYQERLENDTLGHYKTSMNEWFVESREVFSRLLVLERWKKDMSQHEETQRMKEILELKTRAYEGTLENLFICNEIVKNAKESVFDIPTALDVFLTGTYDRLPQILETQEPEDKKTKWIPKVVSRLTDHIRMTLLTEIIPKEMQVVKIENGQVLFRCENEFELLMTITHQDVQKVYSPDGQIREEKNPTFSWRILELDFLVNEEGAPKSQMNMQFRLIQILQARINQKIHKNPLVDLHQKLHVICIKIGFDILEKQSLVLNLGALKGMVTTRLEQNCLKIDYWKNIWEMESCCQMQIVFTPTKLNIKHEFPEINSNLALNLSKLNLQTIFLEFVHQNMILRLESLKSLLESSFNVEMHSKGASSHLLIQLFENEYAKVTVNHKNADFEFQHFMDGFSTGEWSRDVSNINKCIETLFIMKRWCILKYFERACLLLKMDSLLGRDPLAMECLFVAIPKMKHVFVMITVEDNVPIFRVIYKHDILVEMPNLEWKYNQFGKGIKSCMKCVNDFLTNHSQSIRQFQLFQGISKAGIAFKTQENGCVFVVDSLGKERTFSLLVNGANTWQVILLDSPYDGFTVKGKPSGHLWYSNEKLLFSYDGDAFDSFLEDLYSVEEIHGLALQCQNQSIPTTTLTHTKISIPYGNGYQCMIQYLRGRLSLVMNPTHEMVTFLSDFLYKTKNMEMFVNKLNTVSIPCILLKNYHWTLIPRDLNEARIYYKNKPFTILFENEVIFKQGKNIIKKGDVSIIPQLWNHVVLSSSFAFIKENLKKMDCKFQEVNRAISVSFENEYIFEEKDAKIVILCKSLKPLECNRLGELFGKATTKEGIFGFLSLLKTSTIFLKQVLSEIFEPSKREMKLHLVIPHDLNLPYGLSKSLGNKSSLIGQAACQSNATDFGFLVRYAEGTTYVDVPYHVSEKNGSQFVYIQNWFVPNGGKLSFSPFEQIPGTSDKLKKCFEALSFISIQQLINLE